MSFARWQPYYTDRELELDRRIHAFGLLLALIATPLLLGLAAESRRPGLVLPCAIYLLSLLGMLASAGGSRGGRADCILYAQQSRCPLGFRIPQPA